VNETNLFAFGGAQLRFNNWMINPGLRIDYFNFGYNDQLSPGYNYLSESAPVVSPKFNVIYNPVNSWQFYLKSGMGFHTNDSRVATRRPEVQTIPQAYGTDLGVIWKPVNKLVINTAMWHLFMEEEFAYVSDAAAIEPSGKSR
jgi:outer membrane receptor protein involved in Fe transport